jgi:aspartate/methionine/tyrosine aminotransferase
MVTTTFQPFELEHWQSDFEQTVSFNLADSTIQPLSLGELIEGADLDALLAAPLYYPEVNGERTLRERIAALYPGAAHDADDVLVTVGASEANAVIVEALCEPGDRVVVMEPGYRQVWGLARNRGCDLHGFRLRAEDHWRPDLDALERAATPGTKLIYVCSPNNPTGYVLEAGEVDRIVDIAERAGAWLLADEVYRGSERGVEAAPTFMGRGDRVVGVNGLSKAYGLSGLRIGWAIGPRVLIDDLWRRHEYAVIATGRLDNALAEIALTEPARSRILARNRRAVEQGWAVLEPWLAAHRDAVSLAPPRSTPLAFVEYAGGLGSVEVADLIRREAGVLVCPGVYFGCEGYLRFNFGYGADYVDGALAAMSPVVRSLA